MAKHCSSDEDDSVVIFIHWTDTVNHGKPLRASLSGRSKPIPVFWSAVLGKQGHWRPRPIIAQFTCQSNHNNVWKMCHNLKDSNISIGEDLPKRSPGDQKENLKVPLTLKNFISHQKSPFCSDHIGEKIIVVRFSSSLCEFLNFAKYAPLWFTAELQGEWAELVCDVSRGSHFAWRDDERGHRGIVQREKKLPQCLIGVLLRIAVMWWICLSVYLYTTYLSLAIKQPFRENTTGLVGTDSSNSFSGMCLDGNC